MGTIKSSETVGLASALRAQRTTTQADADANAHHDAHSPQSRFAAKQAHSTVAWAAH